MSSWGLSFLQAWGVSWGDTGLTPDPIPEGSPGGIDVGAKRFGFAATKKNKRREEEELILLMSF